MQPWELLGRTSTPAGDEMTLMRRAGEYVIFASGKPLMSSRMHGSEEALATRGCAHLASHDAPWVLVGGLGMGFTLTATLAHVPAGATVVVAELVPGVVAWNDGPLGPLAGHPLRDPRVRVEVGDVAAVLRRSPGRFDAVLLDIDNGPDAFTTTGNQWLYGNAGVTTLREAVTPGGVVAVWSAWEDRKFEQRLRWAGFTVEVVRVRARLAAGGPRHVIFLGVAPGAGQRATPPARPGRRAGESSRPGPRRSGRAPGR
jgi:spermidine synthase